MNGKIVFISGPSGVGKGTLITALKSLHPEWVFPPSYSTRTPRSGETQGNPYLFISVQEFQEKIKKGDFLEYACVHGKDYYGTDRESLFIPADKGDIVIKEFDVQGFEQIRHKLSPDEYMSLFLNLTGGRDELIRRIHERGPLSDEELQKRLDSMEKEFSFEAFYTHTILNDSVEDMVAEAESLILAYIES